MTTGSPSSLALYGYEGRSRAEEGQSTPGWLRLMYLPARAHVEEAPPTPDCFGSLTWDPRNDRRTIMSLRAIRGACDRMRIPVGRQSGFQCSRTVPLILLCPVWLRRTKAGGGGSVYARVASTDQFPCPCACRGNPTGPRLLRIPYLGPSQ